MSSLSSESCWYCSGSASLALDVVGDEGAESGETEVVIVTVDPLDDDAEKTEFRAVNEESLSPAEMTVEVDAEERMLNPLVRRMDWLSEKTWRAGAWWRIVTRLVANTCPSNVFRSVVNKYVVRLHECCTGMYTSTKPSRVVEHATTLDVGGGLYGTEVVVDVETLRSLSLPQIDFPSFPSVNPPSQSNQLDW